MSIEWIAGKPGGSAAAWHRGRFCAGSLTLDVLYDDTAVYQTSLQRHQDGQISQYPPHPLSEQIDYALHRYAEYGQYVFDLPLRVYGTPFQLKVWQLMNDIPAGTTRTYGDMADQLRTAAQPIGGACKANPVPLLVPCHRVVSRQGIGGFSGQWGEGEKIDLKRWLLGHEKATEKATKKAME